MTAGAGEGVGPIHLEEIRGDRGVAANLVEVIAKTSNYHYIYIFTIYIIYILIIFINYIYPSD